MKLAAIAAVVTVLAACSGDDSSQVQSDALIGTPDAAPRQIVMAPRSLLVGEIAESIFTGGSADVAVITLAAPAAKLGWNIHGHASGSTQTVKEELDVMTASYRFVPTAQGDWFLLIRNTDSAPMAVEVTIELYGAMTWSGWQ